MTSTPEERRITLSDHSSLRDVPDLISFVVGLVPEVRRDAAIEKRRRAGIQQGVRAGFAKGVEAGKAEAQAARPMAPTIRIERIDDRHSVVVETYPSTGEVIRKPVTRGDNGQVISITPEPLGS
jgi:hypothetical protein